MVICPAYAHTILQSCVKAGFPFINVVCCVGIHVPAGIGVHGCGVKTPKAAVVAEATCGFDNVVHMPKGPTLVIAELSWIVAAGLPPMVTVDCDVTLSGAGVVPKEHIQFAPATTA